MKKGFTLIELLAVIVILAVIALITTLVVLKVIENVKISKYKIEEKSMEKAAELYYTSNNILPFEKEISLNTLVEKNFMKKIYDSGNGEYCEGKVILEEDGNLKGCLNCSNYVTEGCGYVIEEEIKDENPGVICGDGKAEDYDNQTECHIKSVEDLVAFSSLVNSGKTFEGKTVFLDKDLNMENIDNFQPIGAKATPFKGIFEGNAYTISNLMINIPNENYVGLFGYLQGTSSSEKSKIVGLNVENADILGNDYVGGLVGYLYSNSEVNEVTISGKVEGTGNYVGGITGGGNTATLTSVISNANVSGSKYVGGLAGQGIATFNGIVESGTITGNDYVYGSGRNISNVYINEKVNIESTGSNKGIGGTEFSGSEYGNINLYDDYLDTWLGGDNNNSGYYFDYNESGKIVLKSTEKNPIDTTLNGSGTEEKPYLIYTAEDMKKISAMPTEPNYYKLMNDIDYNNKYYYIIGTKANPFKGIFEGGANTLKNVKVYGYDYVGLFGYLQGTSSSEKSKIVGLNVENVDILGNDYVGGLVGYLYSNSEVNEVTISGKVEGTGNYVGGITGGGNTATLTSVISNANVSGSKYVGGLAGQGIATFNGIVESGTITGNDYVYGSGKSISNAYINEKVNIESTGSNRGIGGTSFTEEYYNNLEYYADLKISSKVVIETPDSGDIDGSGYYFDYNEDGTDIIVVKAENSQ